MSEPANKSPAEVLAITSPAGRTVAAYRFGAALPKPCVHPLMTPAGVALTWFEPADHVWHRGLWYTIKFINGTNFWEEHPPFGIQQSRTPPTQEPVTPGVIRVRHGLEWTSQATGPVIREECAIEFHAAGDDGVAVIDWSTSLNALQDLTLDRTPYTTWGGYGGITFRGAKELCDVSYETSTGVTREIIGDRHAWVILRATAGKESGQRVSVAMIDHPSNPRSPSPWYCRGSADYAFFNAAFLFHEAMTVAAGATLEFRYRFAYRDGEWTGSEFAKWAERFEGD